MKGYKLFVVLLSGLLLFSCQADTVSPEAQTSQPDAVDSEKSETTEILSDELGEYDFEGRSFNIVTCADYFFSPYDVEEETGELLDDAAYNRNRTVEERFNSDIVYTMLGGSAGESADAIMTSVLAGDDEYSLGIVHPYIGLAGLISNAYVLDWNDIPNVDLDKPWWNKSCNDVLSIDGLLPCASSDFVYFNSGCIYFNKEMAEQFQIEDPYALVYDGKWTWDKLSEIALSVSEDLNGDGSYDENDQYGYSIINHHRMIPVTYSMGISPSSKNEDGYIVLDNLGSEKMNSIVNKYYKLLFENTGTYLYDPSKNPDELELFRSGQVLFLHYVTQNIAALRDLDWDFGILPQPKYDESQEEYYSLAQSNVMVVPVTVADAEFVGTIIEALSAYSYQYVMPALYETTFNNKYLRDEDSVAMFDIIKNSLVYDPLWNYNASGNTVYFLSTLMGKRSTDTASYYAANHEAAEASLRDFFDTTLEAYGAGQ